MLIVSKALTSDESGVLGIIIFAVFCRDGAGVSGITSSLAGQYIR